MDLGYCRRGVVEGLVVGVGFRVGCINVVGGLEIMFELVKVGWLVYFVFGFDWFFEGILGGG